MEPEQRLLAGLVHDIGEPAIIHYANASTPQELSNSTLEEAIQHLSAKLGALMLRQWNIN